MRALMRRGVGWDDGVVVFVPREEVRDERAERALDALRKIVEGLVGGGLREVELEVGDLVSAVSAVRSTVLSYGASEVYGSLGGGMRALVVEVLLGLLMLEGVRVYVDIDLESGRGYVSVPLHVFKAPRRERWASILRLLEAGEGVRGVAAKTGLSPATVSREVREMRAFGLVDDELRVTEAGLLYLRVHSS
ncbi:CRISPR locus-related DNA-binding protein [Infirmifilum lucidum]|uniref:CRISPR locus-related DNA-binding protein n=1 Tax=Infirmifilum lucidum TaxID=2776706 RepID=A0A7L9FG89_9CREN|nr:CRISPR locus-related DNA-binding protein [Infirmifilum lucidum]